MTGSIVGFSLKISQKIAVFGNCWMALFATFGNFRIVASVIQFWQLLDFSSFGNFCMNIYCHYIVGNSKVNIQLLYLAGYMFRILQSRENSSYNYIHSKAVTNIVFISS